MHSFGASDCWSMQMVGKFYPENKREKIAELLFSKEVDKSGNPKGIGLSMYGSISELAVQNKGRKV